MPTDVPTPEAPAAIPAIAGGPYDIEFFFDPSCPFAWQTSVWIRRVAELRGVRVGWRFISLRFVNDDNRELPQEIVEAQLRALQLHRICAAARDRCGNDAVGALYRAWGERYWYVEATGEFPKRLATAARNADPEEIVRALGLPLDLLDAAHDESHDSLIRAETEEAFRRTGPDVGTPIITYDPPDGASLFGPVISAVPDDRRALEFYDALRTLADFRGFSELMRSHRDPLDLPLLAG